MITNLKSAMDDDLFAERYDTWFEIQQLEDDQCLLPLPNCAVWGIERKRAEKLAYLEKVEKEITRRGHILNRLER